MNKTMTLFGCGPRIALLALPYTILALSVMFYYPEFLNLAWLNIPAAKAAGFTWLAIGLLFWTWSAIFFLKEFKPGKLITGGPFACCRNPIYASIIIFNIPGLGIIFHSGIILSMAINLFIIFRLSIHGEALVLKSIFKEEYTEYEKSVNEFFPFPGYIFRQTSENSILPD
jgi:protein-S-isoprenylcysteine O-methyltransferase Ste14